MRFSTQSKIFIDRFRRTVNKNKSVALHRTLALIRLEARQSMRIRRRASMPGQPPSARSRGGLREINFHVDGDSGYVGPRLFRYTQRFNRPAPNVQEVGGVVIERANRRNRARIKRYPERSFMYRAVKSLRAKGKLNSKFKYMLRG